MTNQEETRNNASTEIETMETATQPPKTDETAKLTNGDYHGLKPVAFNSFLDFHKRNPEVFTALAWFTRKALRVGSGKGGWLIHWNAFVGKFKHTCTERHVEIKTIRPIKVARESDAYPYYYAFMLDLAGEWELPPITLRACEKHGGLTYSQFVEWTPEPVIGEYPFGVNEDDDSEPEPAAMPAYVENWLALRVAMCAIHPDLKSKLPSTTVKIINGALCRLTFANGEVEVEEGIDGAAFVDADLAAVLAVMVESSKA